MLGFGRRATVVTLQFSHGTCKWKTISSSKKKVFSSHCHFSLPLSNLWCFYCSYSYWDSLHVTEIAAFKMEKQWQYIRAQKHITAWPGRVICVSCEFPTLNELHSKHSFDISYMIPGTCCLSSILWRNNPPKHCLFQGSFKVSRLMERGHQWNCCCFLFWSSRCVCVWFPAFFLPRLVPDSLLKLPSRHLDSLLLCDGIISHTEIFHGLGRSKPCWGCKLQKDTLISSMYGIYTYI